MKTVMSGVIWGQGVIKEETRPLHPNLGTMGLDYVTDFRGNVHAVPRGGGPSWLVETAPVRPIEDTVTITDTESGQRKVLYPGIFSDAFASLLDACYKQEATRESALEVGGYGGPQFLVEDMLQDMIDRTQR